jgi:hypothetical protein
MKIVSEDSGGINQYQTWRDEAGLFKTEHAMKENQASSSHIIEMAKIMSAAAIRRRRRHRWRRNGGNVGQWLKRCH